MEQEYKSIALIELRLLAAHASNGLKGLRDAQEYLLDQLEDDFLQYLVGAIAAGVTGDPPANMPV